MDPDFVVHIQCTIFKFNRGFEGIFKFECARFSKNYFSVPFLALVHVKYKKPSLEAFLVQNHSNNVKPIVATTKKNHFGINTLIMLVWKFSLIKQLRIVLQKHCIQKVHIALKHLNPCFLTNSVQNKYRYFFGKSGAYKDTLKPLLNQKKSILLKQQSLGPWISFTSST